MVHSDSERRDSSASEEGIAGAFLFRGISVRGPLEELAETVDKKVRMYTNLGEVENADRTRHAYELARAKLEIVLAAPPGPLSTCQPAAGQAPERPGDEDAARGASGAVKAGGD
jgi:hypothetical protein